MAKSRDELTDEEVEEEIAKMKERKVEKTTEPPRKEYKEESFYSFRNIVLALAAIIIVASVASFFAGWVGLMIVIAVLILIVAGITFLYTYLAPRNLFFTSISEGTSKQIMVGTGKDAAFVKSVMRYKGHYLDEDWNVVPPDCPAPDLSERVYVKEKSLIEKLFPGLAFVGWPGIYHVYKYKFSWSSRTQKGEVKTNDEEIDQIYVKSDVYYAEVKDAEVGNSMVPVDIKLLLTVKIINPYKALFKVEKWLEYLLNRVEVPIRDYVADAEGPLTLMKGKGNLGNDFFERLKKEGDIEEFRETYGICLIKIQTPDIDLKGWQETATAEWRAQQEGKATLVRETAAGAGYKARRAQEMLADQAYLNTVYGAVREFGDLGTTLRFIDALTEAAKGPSNTIIPFGFIENMAKQVLGPKNSGGMIDLLKEITGKENITKEDAEKVKIALRKMLEGK